MTSTAAIKAIVAAALAAGLSGCMAVGGLGGAKAPEPAKRIDAARFYTGTWLEVARRPMIITEGCIAGTSAYSLSGKDKVAVKDACRVGSRSGRERSVTGDGTIMDPGTNAKMRVSYGIWGSRDYWVLDRAPDYSWFISASPDMNDLYIYTRRVPGKAQLDRLVARAAALGYDTGRLEFPEQPPQ